MATKRYKSKTYFDTVNELESLIKTIEKGSSIRIATGNKDYLSDKQKEEYNEGLNEIVLELESTLNKYKKLHGEEV